VKRRVLWAVWALGVTLALVLGAGHSASAQALPAAPAADNGLLGIIEQFFDGAMVPMAAASATWSAVFFYGLVVLEGFIVCYQGFRCHDWSELIENWVTFIVLYGLGVWIIQNQLANGQWAITEINTVAGTYGNAPTPDSIASNGFTVTLALAAAMPHDPVSAALLAIPQFLVSAAIGIAFGLVAIEDLIVRMAVTLCADIGAIMLAGVACRWTRGYAAMYPKLLVSSLLLLITVNAVAGLGVGVSNFMVKAIGTINILDPFGALGSLAVVMSCSALFILFALGIVGLVAHLGASSPMTSAASVKRAAAAAYSAIAGRFTGAGAGAGAGSAGGATVATLEAATRRRHG
jgi:hypothetical protein